MTVEKKDLQDLEVLEAVLASMTTEEAVTAGTLQGCLRTWLTACDRGAKAELVHGCMLNKMHLHGCALCVVASRYVREQAVHTSLRTTLRAWHDKLVFTDKTISMFEFEDVHAVICALQLQFAQMYEKSDNAFVCAVDVVSCCVLLLAQLGHWLQVKYKMPLPPNAKEDTQELNMPDAALKGFVDVDHDRFCTVRMDALAFLLDALHSMLSLHYMLTQAEFVGALPAGELVEVNGHHKEASAEVFFSLSMTADCMPGSVVQYLHKFAYLFHSISQVVYYNFPTYNRQRQLPLQKLQEANAPGINLLPPLTEMRPDIPVLCEHTGAGHRATHAQHAWSWVLWAQYVFLVDRDMKAYVADDLRTLLHMAQ